MRLLRRSVSNWLAGDAAAVPHRRSDQQGSVTLSGTIQYEYQRHNAVQVTRAVSGVQGVLEKLQVIPTAQHWK